MKKLFNKIILVYIIIVIFLNILFISPVYASSFGNIIDTSVDWYEICPVSGGSQGNRDITVRLNDSDYYATFFYNLSTLHGWVRTFKVWDNNGTIQHSIVDSYMYDAGNGFVSSPNIHHISGTDIYVVSYKGYFLRFNVTTIKISDTGIITKPYIDRFRVSNIVVAGFTSQDQLRTVNVYGGMYAAVLRNDTGSPDSIELYTYFVYPNGTIYHTGGDGTGELDNVRVASNSGTSHPSDLVAIDYDTIAFIIAFSNGTSCLYTYDINITNGDISDNPIDTWWLGTCNYADIHLISNNIYSIIYQGSSYDGYIKTLTINDNGNIIESWIDTILFTYWTGYNIEYTDMFTIHDASLFESGTGIYGITCKDVDDDSGYIFTVTIESDGLISDTLLSDIEIFEAYYVHAYTSVVYVGNDYYLLTYEGIDADGYLQTIEIMTYDGSSDAILNINCYDEITGENITDFKVVITNSVTTYVATGCSNTKSISNSVIPKGDNVLVTVSKIGYNSRSFSIDVSDGYFTVDDENYLIFTLNTYLSNDTHLYYLQVVNEYGEPVDEAQVEIQALVNNTDYEIISTLITDGMGYSNIQLLANETYLVTISKTSYTTKTSSWIPDPVYYGIYYPKVFRIYTIPYNQTPEYNNRTVFFDVIMLSNSSLFIEHNSSICGSNTVEIYIYEHLNYTTSLNGSYDYTTCNNSFYHSPINTSRMYTVYFYQNFTDTLNGNYYYVRTVMPLTSYEYNATYIEGQVEDVYGAWGPGYVNFFLLFLPFVVIIVFVGHVEKGLAAIVGGFYLAFANSRIEGLGLINIYEISAFCVAIGLLLFLVYWRRGKT